MSDISDVFSLTLESLPVCMMRVTCCVRNCKR